MASTDITPTRHKAVFFAKAPNHRLVRSQIIEEVSALGMVRKLTPGLTYEFEDGYLIVDDALRKETAQYFKKYADILGDGVDTRPPEEWLRDHPKLNGEHGFVEIEPVAPDAGPLLQKIASCAIASDTESLALIHEVEEGEWRRPAVLEAALEALTMLEERDKPKAPVSS